MKSEIFITCPVCGKDEKSRDCSYNATAWHCFVCGSGGSLADLARRQGIPVLPRAVPAQADKRLPSWRTSADEAQRILARYTARPDRYQHWQAYKPVSTSMIDRLRWGVGSLDLYPYTGWHTSRCPHDRLIYPVMWDGQIVAFRGRQIACHCDGESWLNMAGSVPALYGIDEVPAGSVLVLCENPIDAMLVHEYQHGDVYGAATTGGAGTWRPEWTARLAALHLRQVVVWYDNDLAGCPNSETLESEVAAWRAKMQAAFDQSRITAMPSAPPAPHGPRVAALLRAAGIPTALGAWPPGTPRGWDIGAQIALELGHIRI